MSNILSKIIMDTSTLYFGILACYVPFNEKFTKVWALVYLACLAASMALEMRLAL